MSPRADATRSRQREKELQQALDEFTTHFGQAGDVYLSSAPGRVNLIGEHTDYNDGFVLPLAIDRRVELVFRARQDTRVRLRSALYSESDEFVLDDIESSPERPWSNYVRGVATVLQAEGVELCGLDAVVAGTVPLGAGLSSSAALEVATAKGFLQASGAEVEPRRLARLCQRAENQFVGVNCGIMDQFVSIFGRSGSAVLIDCRELSHELVPLDAESVTVLVCNTMVRHELGNTEYNTRRQQCETAAKALSKRLSGAQSLRDVTIADLEKHAETLSPTVLKRARHVVTENERVMRTVSSLKSGDYAAVGKLMDDSHNSLQSDYEVSCRELDVMVSLARRLEGVFGARMTGGGFGGCAVALVGTESAADVAGELARQYEEKTGIAPEIYPCLPAEGAFVSHAEPGAQ